MRNSENEIKDMSANLSEENKKYVIAVANALLFSQNNRVEKSENNCGRNKELCKV